MSNMFKRWESFCLKRDKALKKSERTLSELRVIAVSKKQSLSSILEHIEAIREFPRDLGENYLQELESKCSSEALLAHPIRWHFIGSIQSKKIPQICNLSSAIHSVGRIKELRALAAELSKTQNIPKFFVQFNTSQETSKNGFPVSEASLVLDTIHDLHLTPFFEGLMCSAAPIDDVGEGQVRLSFARLRDLREKIFLNAKLNMGMTEDFDLAIQEGADIIRVGSALFGERPLSGH